MAKAEHYFVPASGCQDGAWLSSGPGPCTLSSSLSYRMPQSQEFIDVRELIASRAVAEHNALAEDYFAKLEDWTYHLGKPFSAFDETPQLLVNFAVILQGLNLCPGMTVFEFGAGTCWASRWLTQFAWCLHAGTGFSQQRRLLVRPQRFPYGLPGH